MSSETPQPSLWVEVGRALKRVVQHYAGQIQRSIVAQKRIVAVVSAVLAVAVIGVCVVTVAAHDQQPGRANAVSPTNVLGRSKATPSPTLEAPTATPIYLSDARVQTCQLSAPAEPPSPGVLIASFNGHDVTHFLSNEPFQLIYSDPTGSIVPESYVEVDFLPCINGAVDFRDMQGVPQEDMAIQQTAHSQITITLAFPYAGATFRRSGPYLVLVDTDYETNDGVFHTGEATIGLVEQS